MNADNKQQTKLGHGRRLALALLAVLYLAAVGADWVAPYSYERQFRDSPSTPPSGEFRLGTDALGRDRLSRLIYGTRVSLVLAPAAALLAVGGAALLGGLAALVGGWWERAILGAADLTSSLPWILLLICLRALLPLNVAALESVAITFGLLGLLGWAGPARVVRAGVREVLQSDFLRSALARGVPPGRLLVRHLLPNVRPVLAAQFWTMIPVFILAEANLGLLGLGVTEPLPSWGTLLKELESQASAVRPFAAWWVLTPVAVVGMAVLCFHAAARESRA